VQFFAARVGVFWLGTLCVGSLVQWHSSGYVGLANLGSESETCVGSRVRLVGVFISFKKNFYRPPFTSPPLVHHIGPSNLLGAVGDEVSWLAALEACPCVTPHVHPVLV
jgi:hypothetical protein